MTESITINAPWFSHALAGAMMLLGLVLWLFGGKALRVAFATFGTAIGIIVGIALPPEIAGGPMRVLAVVVGGLLGALLGGAAFRFTVAFVLAAAFAIVVPVLTAELSAQYGSPVEQLDPDQPLTETELYIDGVRIETDQEARDLFDQHKPSAHIDPDGQPIGADQKTEPDNRWRIWLDRCERFVGQLINEYQAAWDNLPARDKSLLVITCIGGLVFGLAIGLALQKTSAILVAAGAGGILFLPATVWLIHASGAPTQWLPATEGAWTMVWIGLSAIGALTQRFLIPPKKKQSKPGDDTQ